MIAENKRTGNQVEFTLEQWRNLENTGHARYWKIINAEIMPQRNIEPQVFSKPVTLDVEYHSYRQLLEKEGIKYNKSIKNELKLKEIYELNKKV